uniref:Uncharacterized protein n=1 Tax=Tetraselmis sp. GSL018 TaxID=582737 RepID=A0A061R9H9_9CHLO
MESQKNKKFGCPLYSAAWASPSCVVLAGGGGKKTSGIKNKILAVPVRNGALEEETLACSTGETEFDVPYRLLLHPDLAGGLVAMAGSGGCRSVEVARAPDGTLSSIALGTEGTAACKRLTADTGVSRICFGGRRMDSAFLGLEDGRVLVLSYPTLELKVRPHSHPPCPPTGTSSLIQHGRATGFGN